jgi:acetyl esterase/lipase
MGEDLSLVMLIVRMVTKSLFNDLPAALCRSICYRTHSIVVSVGYRHAPEYPYPIPVEDSYAGVLWVTEAESLG